MYFIKFILKDIFLYFKINHLRLFSNILIIFISYLFLPLQILAEPKIKPENILISQVITSSAEDNIVPTEPPQNTINVPVILSNREITLSFAVLLFGVLVLSLEFIVIKNLGKNINAQDLLILFTVTLIIVGTLFLISSGVSSNQIAPALGLYGTIVGYLLGREAERGFHNKKKRKNKTNNESEND